MNILLNDIHNLITGNQILDLLISIIIGHLIGKIRIMGITVGGIIGTLIAAISISILFGSVTPAVKGVFLSVFMFAVGYDSGPALMTIFRLSSVKHLILTIFLSGIALLTVLLCAKLFHLDKGMAAGIAAGGLTQSAVLGTALNALSNLNMPNTSLTALENNMAVGFAVSYLFGVIIPIMFCINGVEKLFKRSIRFDAIEEETALKTSLSNDEMTMLNIRQPYMLMVFDTIKLAHKTIDEVERHFEHLITIHKIKRNEEFITATPEHILQEKDQILIFGRSDILLNSRDNIGHQIAHPTQEWDVKLVFKELLVRSKRGAGLSFADTVKMRKDGLLRGICFLWATRKGEPINIETETDFRSKVGDTFAFYGFEDLIFESLSAIGGVPAVANKKTDFFSLGLGLVLGAIISQFKFRVFGIDIEASSFAMLITGLLFGWINYKNSKLAYVPPAAIEFLRDFGITAFVAAVGLSAGENSINNMLAHGISITVASILVSTVPLVVSYFFARYILKYNNAAVLAGALAGARSAGSAFGMVLDRAENSVPTVYFAINYAISSVTLSLLGPIIIALV